MPKKSTKDESNNEKTTASKPEQVVVEEKPKKGAKKADEVVIEEKPKKGAKKADEVVVEEKPKKGAKKADEVVVEEKPKKGAKKAEVVAEEKPKKGAKVEAVSEDDEKSKNIIKKVEDKVPEDDEKYKQMLEEFRNIVEVISNHNIKGNELDEKRNSIVSKMDQYLNLTKGAMSENILETTTKLKKPITKVDVPGKIDEDESDSDSSDSDTDDEDTDDEATPAEPLKKGKQIIKFNVGKKNKGDDSSSDSD